MKFRAQSGKEKGKTTQSERKCQEFEWLESIPYLRISSLTFIVSWMLRADTSLLGQRQRESLVFIAVAEARVSAFLFQCPEPSFP